MAKAELSMKTQLFPGNRAFSRTLPESRSALFGRRVYPNATVFFPFLISNRPITVNLMQAQVGGSPGKPLVTNRSVSPPHRSDQRKFRIEGRTMRTVTAALAVERSPNIKLVCSTSSEQVASPVPQRKVISTVAKSVSCSVRKVKPVLKPEDLEVESERVECVTRKEGLFYREPAGEVSDRSGGETKTVLLAPIFRGRPHTVLFLYPPQCSKPPRTSPRAVPTSPEDLQGKTLYYTYSDTAHIYNCIQRVLEFNGFKETDGDDFTLYLSSDITPKLLLEFDAYQKYNHYPGSWQLGRKDNLWRNFVKMRRSFGEEYDFCPQTFVFPEDFVRFQREREARPSDLWILKPAASACGRGIRVLSNKSKVKNKTGYLVSSYISNPHLLNGLKYDLRLYVCVTSYDPLRIYLYREGLVRFASEEYTTAKSSVTQRFVHLTNYSVNKRASTYKFNKRADHDSEGNKWSHTAYKRKLAEQGIDPEAVFARVKDVIVKTIISAEANIANSVIQYTKNRGNCFETYGFDVLLDETLRPWLMEVNVSPSLNSGSPLDRRIKASLIADVYTLIGFVPCDREVLTQDSEQQRQNRIFGLNKSRQKRPTLQAVAASKRLEDLDLPEAEITMLMELEEELSRCGDFECLFPVKETLEKYSKLLQVDRVNNRLTWKLILEDPDFLAPYRLGPIFSV